MAETVSTVHVVNTAALPALLTAATDAGKPLHIRVPDVGGDPCGMRKIVRVLVAAHTSDTWDAENERYTVGRWSLYFGDPYAYPPILITSRTATYEITDDAPEESGPCKSCREHAARVAEEAARAGAGSAVAAIVIERMRALEAGRDAGYAHENYLDNIGGEDKPCVVPGWYADNTMLADSYREGFDAGREDYQNEHHDG